MKRSEFIKTLAAGAASVAFSQASLGGESMRKLLLKAKSLHPDKILVVIRMNGGLDAIAALTPMDQYDNLQVQRSNILDTPGNLHGVSNDFAFHQKLSDLATLHNEGNGLSIFFGIGDPNAGRSHFSAMRIVETGGYGRELGLFGQMGDEGHFDPVTSSHPIGVSVGYSRLTQGLTVNYAYSIDSSGNFSGVGNTSGMLLPDGSCTDHLWQHMNTINTNINTYSQSIVDALDNGLTVSQKYGTDYISSAMQQIARMISGGLATNFYMVDARGYDTHSNQVPRLEEQLERINDAVAGFQEDMVATDNDERVLGVSYSEFGRQTRSNASAGTDHGDATICIVFGGCVKNKIYGSSPNISSTLYTGQQGIPLQFAFSDVFASAFHYHFGIDQVEISNAFDNNYLTFFNFMNTCSAVALEEESDLSNFEAILWPNPCISEISFKGYLEPGDISINIYDTTGRSVLPQRDITIKKRGIHNIQVDISELSRATYFMSINNSITNHKLSFVKR